MAGFFSTQASASPRLTSLQIQSSVYGIVLKVTYGKTRVSPMLFWYRNFHQTGGGGKGKGSGKP